MHRRFNCHVPCRSRCSGLLGFLVALMLFVTGVGVLGQLPYQNGDDFARYAMKLRESAILRVEPPGLVAPVSQPRLDGVAGGYSWKMDIMTTVFWVGEKPTRNNPVPNTRSAWDRNWVVSYGGFDNPDPSARRNYIPVNFTPRQNPFYCALPYNDVTEGATKPEAAMVIPWFKKAYRKFGESVCRNRWIEIYAKHNGRACYAQWSDCGPFRTDHWQYVFGDERPASNINQGAGLDVSPAVRDFLGLSGMDVTSWRFVESRDVPPGPWSNYGDNNDFVIRERANTERLASRSAENSGTPEPITR